MMTTLSQVPKHFGPQCTSLYCCVDQSLVTSIPSTNFVCKKVCRGEKRNISQSFAVSATFCSIQQSSICTSTPLGQRKAKRGLSWKAPNRHTSLIEQSTNLDHTFLAYVHKAFQMLLKISCCFFSWCFCFKFSSLKMSFVIPF